MAGDPKRVNLIGLTAGVSHVEVTDEDGKVESYDVTVQLDVEFLRSQRIARLSTVGPSGWPHVVPVIYSIDEEGSFEFDVDGIKLRNLSREPRAAMVVDAMGPKRGVAIQGKGELIGPERARLRPVNKFSWGL